MKNFKPAPIVLAVAAVFSTLALAEVPSKGDLDIYTASGNADKGSTILFMFDSSRYMAGDLGGRDLPGDAPGILNNETLAVSSMSSEQAVDSTGTITYKRRFFQALNIQGNNPKFSTRITRLKDAVFYLLDTPGLLPEDYKIGAGHFPASSRIANSGPDIDYSRNDTVASSQTSQHGAIIVPARTIGPVDSPQRMKLKRYVASLCDLAADNNTSTLQDCGGAPMAWSYADAGAYMMGTKTDKLVNEGITRSVLYNTVLRGNNPRISLSEKTWEYCPEDKRKMVMFAESLFRLTCRDSDWVPMSRDNTHGYSWSDTLQRPWMVANDLIVDVTVPTPGWIYYRETSQSDVPRPPTSDKGRRTYDGSGLRYSPWDVRNDKSYTYEQPKYSECSGVYQTDAAGNQTDQISVANSIIYFTAGWPYNSNVISPEEGMKMALSPASALESPNPVGGPFVCDSELKGGYFVDSGLPLASHWQCMGSFAKRLNSTQNPLGTPVKTGVFLFARNDQIGTKYTTINGNQVLDCDALEVESQKNACKLGTPGYGYGEGGYTQITRADSDDASKFASLILKMTKNTKANMGLVPSGIAAMPKDSFGADSMVDSVYLPLIEPTLNDNAQWRGNLRKYGFANGDYQNNPYASTSFPNALLAAVTTDDWAKPSATYNSSKLRGGVFDNIAIPGASTEDIRRVFISKKQDEVKTNSISEKLPQIKPMRDSITSVEVADTEKNTLQRLLLNYMGYSISEAKYREFIRDTSLSDSVIIDTASTKKTLGGVYHSTPISLTAKLTFDSESKNYEPLNQYILFGGMDNALHVVDNSSGEEVFSFFPREVLGHNGQYKAITDELPASITDGESLPSFGVDGPWTSYAKYSAGNENEDIVAEKLYAYGGARLGAKAYYGLNLSGIETSAPPEQLFAITPNTKYKGSSVFERLGYTWGKPVVTNIRWQGERKLVVVLTGGYDTYFDKTDSVRRVEYSENKAPLDTGTTGNAVYIVDALTGQPLIVSSSSVSSSDLAPKYVESSDENISNTVTESGENDVIYVESSHLKYSVPGSVKVLDRDADELADSLYFTDLNGQVFRMDINNAASKPSYAGNENATNPTVRVVRMANLVEDSNLPIGPRLYETPVVTIHDSNQGRFAVVSMASGDRSNPLWPYTQPSYKVLDEGNKLSIKGDPGSKVKVVVTRGEQVLLSRVVAIPDSGQTELLTNTIAAQNPRMLVTSDKIKVTVETASDKAKNNHVFAIYDRDVGKSNFFNTTLTTVGLGFDDLKVLEDSGSRDYSNEKGWKAVIDKFDVFSLDASGNFSTQTTTTKAVKSLGSLAAIDSKLYVPVYNPVDGLSDQTGCLVEVKGSTEALQYCLPYGVCETSSTDSSNQVSRVKTGKGIQNIVFGNAENGSQSRSLLVAQDVSTGNLSKLDTDAPDFKSSFVFKPLLRPLAWFDFQSKLED